jgi:long-subunit acyl-CoA synthetase (AMP-forming)
MISATLEFSAEDRYLSILPLAHTLERTVEYTMVAKGAGIAYGRGMDSLSRDAIALKPTVLIGVPRLFEQIYRSARDAARGKGRIASHLFSLAEAAAIRRGRTSGCCSAPDPPADGLSTDSGTDLSASREKPWQIIYLV